MSVVSVVEDMSNNVIKWLRLLKAATFSERKHSLRRVTMEDRNNCHSQLLMNQSVAYVKVGILQDKLQDLVRLISGPDCSNLV